MYTMAMAPCNACFPTPGSDVETGNNFSGPLSDKTECRAIAIFSSLHNFFSDILEGYFNYMIGNRRSQYRQRYQEAYSNHKVGQCQVYRIRRDKIHAVEPGQPVQDGKMNQVHAITDFSKIDRYWIDQRIELLQGQCISQDNKGNSKLYVYRKYEIRMRGQLSQKQYGECEYNYGLNTPFAARGVDQKVKNNTTGKDRQ